MVFDSRDSSGVYALRSYLWKLLEANLDFSEQSYEGDVPILPLAQQPELLKSGRPFIVYNSAVQPSGYFYQLRSESVGIYVYATKSTEVDNIVNLIVDALERGDESAADINWWLDNEHLAGRASKRELSFTSVDVAMSERARPADEEGGYNSAMVLLTIRYVRPEKEIVTRDFEL